MKFAFVPKPWEPAVRDLEAAGHTHVSLADGPDMVLFNGGPEHFPETLPASVKVVQVCYAGIEELLDVMRRHDVAWANAAGLYDDTVAESALALILAVYHRHNEVRREWNNIELFGSTDYLCDNKKVAIIGAGGIGKKLIEFLRPFGVDITAVNRSGRAVNGANRSIAFAEGLDGVWRDNDVFVLLAPLTDETRRVVDKRALALMKDTAILVNVGRGPLVDHDALTEALTRGVIAGAGLDVTDPEPLPADHPLWDIETCVITPHTANIPRYMKARVGALAAENWECFARGVAMRTQVDPAAGY